MLARRARGVVRIGVDVRPYAVQAGGIPGDAAIIGFINKLVFDARRIQQAFHGARIAQTAAAAVQQHCSCGVGRVGGLIRRGAVDQLFIEPQRTFKLVFGLGCAELLHPCGDLRIQQRLLVRLGCGFCGRLGSGLRRGFCGRFLCRFRNRRLRRFRSGRFRRRLGRFFGRYRSRFCGRRSRRLRSGCRRLRRCTSIFNVLFRIHGHAAEQHGSADER